jgi:hypothetical protein
MRKKLLTILGIIGITTILFAVDPNIAGQVAQLKAEITVTHVAIERELRHPHSPSQLATNTLAKIPRIEYALTSGNIVVTTNNPEVTLRTLRDTLARLDTQFSDSIPVLQTYLALLKAGLIEAKK